MFSHSLGRKHAHVKISSGCCVVCKFVCDDVSAVFLCEPQSFPMLQFLLECQVVDNLLCQVAPHEDKCLLNRSHVGFISSKLRDVETLVLIVLLAVLSASDLHLLCPIKV